jgi:hypothetical protein
MNIQYLAYMREERFIRSVHLYLPAAYVYDVKNEVNAPFDFLKGKDAVVIVGTWGNIFRHDRDYYLSFLMAVKQGRLPLAAIIGELETLPKGNKHIDKVITRERGKKTIEQIARELHDFLPSRPLYST